MWVVKLGGSLAYASELPRWLSALAEGAGGRAIIVPGGGPFADQVRHAQSEWKFSDEAAHAMAVLAMEQFGLMMTGIEPRLAPVRDRAQIENALASGRVAVWLPCDMMRGHDGIPRGWGVTSDSLAAWLAHTLAARHLLLVKSVPAPPGDRVVSELVREGIVDAALPGFIRDASYTTWWVDRSHYSEIGAIMEERYAPGSRVVYAL
ncbi:MAG: amino acid kinase [Chromatiales bacterium]